VFWLAVSRPGGGGHGRYALTGILVGAAALIRPIAVGAGIVFAAAVWLTRRDLSLPRRLGLIAALLLGNVGAVLPWEVWVYNRTGQAVLLGTHGASSMADGLAFAYGGYRQEIKVPAGVRSLMENALARSHELESSRDILRFLAREFRERPIAVGQWLALKIARSWYGTDSGRYEAAILVIQAFYVSAVLWATVVAWRRRGTARQLAVIVWMMVVYTWAMSSLVLPILRYMVPALGLLFVLLPALVIRTSAGSRSSLTGPAAETHTY
jgi:hypothetical protein